MCSSNDSPGARARSQTRTRSFSNISRIPTCSFGSLVIDAPPRHVDRRLGADSGHRDDIHGHIHHTFLVFPDVDGGAAPGRSREMGGSEALISLHYLIIPSERFF